MSGSQTDLLQLLPGPQVLPLPRLRGTQRTGQEPHGVWSKSYSESPRLYNDLTPPHTVQIKALS